MKAQKFSKASLLDEEDEYSTQLDRILARRKKSQQEDSGDLDTISFGSLSKAQARLQTQERESKKKVKKVKKPKILKESEDSFHPPSDISDDGEFFEEQTPQDRQNRTSDRHSKEEFKSKSKHAPSESSAKKRVSKVREIPGLLNGSGSSSLYQDVRFDTAFGKADLQKARENYKFLDEYREKEISELNKILQDDMTEQLLSEKEINTIKYKIQSLKSRVDTLKNRDLENEIVRDYKRNHKNFFLKNSDKRKLVQKAKFDSMKPSQREKVIERKRKRQLGREFKQLEFNQK
ncbi:BA75_01737T0 [Komagataella pastoris]|uniref:rRNA biogenesis protein RRP36 n=1 Tax=Komagataella pastoris TaxID=4922 RepID=A0A1B2J8I2_PICPA|nr:BA75_01737T0 [Komagataella pastoris]